MARAFVASLFALLALPATGLAYLSFLLLAAPWANHGLGAVITWLFIADFWAFPAALIAASSLIWRRRWPLARAALLPGGVIAVLLLLEAATHLLLQRCSFWC